MACDTSDLPFAKPPVTKRAHLDAALDRCESAKVRKRSEGQCEVYEQEPLDVNGPTFMDITFIAFRCQQRAVHVMHLIGGRGTRGVGRSALAIHKLHGCARHHREIDGDLGGRKWIRVGGAVPMWTDIYRRVT